MGCDEVWSEFFLNLLIGLDGDVAWLSNCTKPLLIRRGSTLFIQKNLPSYSYWAGFLKRLADDIGLQHKLVDIPLF